MSAINLLPWREWRRARAVRRLQWALLVALLLGGVFTAVAAIQLNHRLEGHLRESVRLSERISGLQDALTAVDALRARRDALLEQGRELQALQARRQPAENLLARLTEIVPAHVRLDRLQLTADELSLTGLARSGGEVAQLLRNLGRSPELEVPDLREVKSSLAGERFQMTAGFRQLSAPDRS